MALSKFLPPSQLSPSVSLTCMMPSSTFTKQTSKVPPPKSKIKICPSLTFSSSPYAMAAAMGSCNNSTCEKPASSADFWVADFWLSLNIAGMVITTDLKLSFCTKDFNFLSTSEDKSSEEKSVSINEEWYFLSEPMVRLNSINVLEEFALPFLRAASFSEFN